MSELGTVKRHGFDDKRHERRERLMAIAECAECGKDVELWAETESWTKLGDGKWKHQHYGCAMGVCEDCDLLYVDNFGQPECYDLAKAEPLTYETTEQL